MTMSTQLAICCGRVVTTWDCHSDAREANNTSFDTPIVDVSWNTSGQVLASCLSVESSKDNNVVLSSTSLGGNTLLDSFRHDAGLKRPATPKNKNANPTCIEFGVKSRYLVVGDECGAVCLWDLKKKARVRHYFHSSSSGYSSSLQATLDPTDSNVLSLSETSLNIFRLREATLAATITGTSRFCKFSTSPLEPRNVAIGGRIGNVDLYDVSLQNKILSMSPHTGPITGVAMSKVSKLLVASASMDETLAFSDTASGNTVQQMKLGSPATSMSFHDNGRTCAVGTESGRVLVYDLRKTSDVIATCEVVGRVSCVQFAPGNGTAAANTTKPRRSTLSLTDSTEQDHTSSSVDELGRVVDSVLNRSRDSSSNAAVASKENKRPTVPLATSQSLDKDAVRAIVREELDEIRDEMEQAVRTLQVDVCRQFLKQSQEYSQLVSRLQEENAELRQENDFLRHANER